MSNTALFLATGIVVKSEGKNSKGESYQLLPTLENSKYQMTSDEGKITEFKIFSPTENIYKIYIYINYSHLLDRDKKQNEIKISDGFCLLTHYNDYKNYKIRLSELFFNTFWFDSNFELAEASDNITIERLDFSNSSKFYVQKNYTFDIVNPNIDFTDPSKYPNPTVITTEIDLLQSYSGKFYSKNIPALETIESKDKVEFTKLLTFICFRADYIVDKILIIFTMRDNNNLDKTFDTIKQAVRKKYIDNNDTLYKQLPKIDQVIGELLKDWGYVDGVEASFMFEGKSIDYIRNYYNSISSFYVTLLEADEKVYFKYDIHGNPENSQGISLTHDGELDDDGNVIHVSQEEKDKKDSERRVGYLFKFLTTEGLGIFDFDQRMAWLKDLVGQTKLEQQSNSVTQNNFIKLLNTFVNKDEAGSLLDYLLESNGAQTNFEVVYNKLDDGRLERYPIVNWFLDEATNRKYFVYTIYNAWKFSNYNTNYIPQGQTANDDGVNPNSYFLNEGKKYYPKFDSQGNLKSGSNPVLAFSVSKVEDSGNYYVQVLNDKISYVPRQELNREIITIDVVESTTIMVTTPNGQMPSPNSSTKKYGDYHLYQPISLLGYEADLDLEIPNLTPIPAFLFYYAADYDDLKDFDAAMTFAIQVTVDIALFYFTGGASALKHLSYLKYIYNFRKGMVAADAVLVWRGIDAAAETVAVTSGVLTAYFDYEATVSNDPRLKDLYKKLSMFFLGLTLGTAGGAVYSRVKIVKAADEVLSEMSRLNGLTPPVQHKLPQNVVNVIVAIGNIDQKITLMSNKIVGLDLSGAANNILTKYNSASYFTRQERYQYFVEYYGLDIKDYWVKMNVNNAEFVDIWKNVEMKSFRKNFWFLENTSIMRNADEMNEEIFLGVAERRPKKGVSNPSQINDYEYKGKGIHHNTALRNNNPNALGEIVGTENYLGKGFYEAKLRVWNSYLGNWKVKKELSTFFPDNWSPQRIQEELAIAFKNKKFDKFNAYDGEMSNGIKVRFHIDNGVIKSAYPNFK